MSRPDLAARVPIIDLYEDPSRWTGRKIRTVGFLTACDTQSSTCIVACDRGAIVLDLSLCLDEGSSYLPRIKTKVDVLGDLEAIDVSTAVIANDLLDQHVAAIPRPHAAADDNMHELAFASASSRSSTNDSNTNTLDQQASSGLHGASSSSGGGGEKSEIAPVVLRCIHFSVVDELDLRKWNDAARILFSYMPGQGS
ncbi:hypothetical protein V8E36_002585 [Tilletia maclaganii]